MEKPLISIIIPVYNVENYLDQCIHSVVNQTYRNLEIILVDDGSTDYSGQICDVWAEKDRRIRVIHKQNGGLSDARNVGLDAANGKYIAAIDSDDTVSTEITEHLWEIVEKNDSEIAICDLVHCYPGKPPVFQSGTKERIFSVEDALCELMYQKSFLYAFWGKIYKKSLLDDIRFPVGKLFEDVAIMYKIFSKANHIVYSDAKLYGYLHRDNSITTKAFTKRDCDILQICQEQVDFAQDYSPKVYNAALAYQVVGAFRIYLNAPTDADFEDELKTCKKIIQSNGVKVLLNKNVRNKTKGAILLYFCNPGLMRIIYKKIDRWK